MEEEVKSPAVKTSEQIDEKPWVFLEKELREFEKVMKQLEEGEFQSNFNFNFWHLFLLEVELNSTSIKRLTSIEEESGEKPKVVAEKPKVPPKPKMIQAPNGKLKPVPPPRPTKVWDFKAAVSVMNPIFTPSGSLSSGLELKAT